MRISAMIGGVEGRKCSGQRTPAGASVARLLNVVAPWNGTKGCANVRLTYTTRIRCCETHQTIVTEDEEEEKEEEEQDTANHSNDSL